MKQKWIITGANGYLGGQLCKYLHDQGETVLGVVRPDRSVDALQGNGIPCDTYETISSYISEGDVVMHCAGKVGNAGSWEDFVQINSTWAVALYEQAQKNGASCFVYVSSVAALGYKNRFNKILDESSEPLHVFGELYGRSKLLAEQALLEKSKGASTRLVVLRPGLIYGNRSFSAPQNWLRRGFIIDSKQRIPLTHINNFADAIFKVVSRKKAQGVFLVVDEEQPEVHELNALKIQYGILKYKPWHIGKVIFGLIWLCRGIYRLMHRRFDSSFKNQAIADYYFQTRRIVYSTKKLCSETEWTPLVKLKEGLMRSAQEKKRHG